MEKEEIEKEINKLKNFQRKFNLSYADKKDARKLISEITKFNHLFTSEYIHAQPFYRKNMFAEIDITDGINDLNSYLESKIKEKDDNYCIRGSERINSGIGHIISSLEMKI
jgi:hypothetical protein